jgi:O-antigen ligase
VPIAYRLLPGSRTLRAVDVMISAGALSAVYGIVQYGIFDFDNLGQRVQGTLGHYMTYSGLIMLVACVAAARVMFKPQDRLWAALIMPAVLVALALTFSRNAWVGACAGISLLFVLRDFRLVALVPIVAALFVVFAPVQLSNRFYSTFSLTDPTNADRLAMIRSGIRMIEKYPLTGVGPDMVIEVYPHYRDAAAVTQRAPHLHNVPLQIAAERGLPALAAWLWFIVVLTRDLWRKTRTSPWRSLPTAALAAVVAMLAAGMFEYNFGDSEFLMIFLLLVTLPYAADDAPASSPAVRHSPQAA